MYNLDINLFKKRMLYSVMLNLFGCGCDRHVSFCSIKISPLQTLDISVYDF